MAQRGGDDELADRLAGISLESVSAGEGKSSIGPAGLIHKVRDVRVHVTRAKRTSTCSLSASRLSILPVPCGASIKHARPQQ